MTKMIAISEENSRDQAVFKKKNLSWEDFCEKLGTPVRTPERAVDYVAMSKKQKNIAKDHGGFVGGSLIGGYRQKDKVRSRSVLVFDLDALPPDFLDTIASHIPNRSFWHTTHSHTPANPRVRILIPTSRDMTPDEFNAVARIYAEDNGFLELIDPCCLQPHQMMYWPSCPTDGEFRCGEIPGDWLNPDIILAAHPEWRDCSLLPLTPQETARKSVVVSSEKQADPLSKNGVIGAVCRTYSIQDIISKYLSDIYAPSANDPNRYDYIPGEGSSGVVIYDNKFCYSHHATDPAGGILCNAFDLVRIHKFGALAENESISKATKLFLADAQVRVQLQQDRENFSSQVFSDWKKGLQYGNDGKLINNLHNIILILENDENLKNIVFNLMADCIEVIGPVPWKRPDNFKFWRNQDDAQLLCYLDTAYGSFSERNYKNALNKVTDDRSYHPIREYLSKLPLWDGIHRVDTLLIDYLGAKDTPYVRAITRKILCAAVTRIYRPGTKFDSILVLNGPQGIGKSTLISRLGRDWYSDSLNLNDVNDKTAAEKLQGYWIIEFGELSGMKKADLDRLKAFFSRRDDKYRAAFSARVTSHPRQTVFFGTTNAESGYLRDITGNRRYWNVKVPGSKFRRPWDLSEEEIQQIWAEVLIYYKNGEDLCLDEELEKAAAAEQSDAMEQDEREGLVRDYLDRLLPENWDSMELSDRRNFIHHPNNSNPPGVKPRDSVSNIEIFCECFEKDPNDLTSNDSYTIKKIMERIEGWDKIDKRKHLPIYGQQRVYMKKDI